MADYGIKISKEGYDVKTVPTDATKKNYTILADEEVLKVSTQAVVAADTNIAHGLGFTPMFDAYGLENSLSEAILKGGESYLVSADSTYLYVDELFGSNSLFYIIYLNQP